MVFWPVLPRNADMVAREGKSGVVDHITLELSNWKSHLTAYNADGQSHHTSAADLGHEQAWRLREQHSSGLALWFSMLVRWSVLLDQEAAVQRRLRAPTPAEAERRKMLFTQAASQMQFMDFPLPNSVTVPEYVYCSVYFVVGENGDFRFMPELFPSNQADSEIDGWPDGSTFEIQPKALKYEMTKFVIATACPPGVLRPDVAFALPRLNIDERI